jgi:hypothetical protein
MTTQAFHVILLLACALLCVTIALVALTYLMWLTRRDLYALRAFVLRDLGQEYLNRVTAPRVLTPEEQDAITEILGHT